MATLRKINCSPKEVEKCDELRPVEGPPLSGIYLGTVQEGEEITNIQLKLVQTGRNVADAYYRESSCGTVRGTVDTKGDMLFEWAWGVSQVGAVLYWTVICLLRLLVSTKTIRAAAFLHFFGSGLKDRSRRPTGLPS